MYTICEIKGKQYQIEEGKEYRVDYLNLDKDSELVLDKILLYKSDDGSVKIGNPFISSAKVHLKVVEPVIKDKKVYAFKYKRRKGFRKLIGHRQKYSVVKVEKIEI
ncbi:MAG: 50S ribosomal protein L21 [Exilispira sp.]